MKKAKLWMMAAILTPAALMMSCTDREDNPVTGQPVENPAETEEQAAFWSKFDAWQSDSCTTGDDFYMHMTGKFFFNPTSIYPGGMLSYATDIMGLRESTIYDMDADVKTMKSVLMASKSGGATEVEVEQMAKARTEELWQGATTRDEAMQALGRAAAAGYIVSATPRVKIVDGKPAWVIDTDMPPYYSSRDLQTLELKKDLQMHRAYRGGQSMRRAAGVMDADMAAFIKGMNLGVAAEDVIWEEDGTDGYQKMMETMVNNDSIKNFINAFVAIFDGLLISDQMLALYSSIPRETASGRQITLPLTRQHLVENLRNCWGNAHRVRAFEKKYVTADMKRKYLGWCEEFRNAFQKRLEKNTWLSELTRANALEKLKNVDFKIIDTSDLPDVAIPSLEGCHDIIDYVRTMRQARMDGYRWTIGRQRTEVLTLLNYVDYDLDFLSDNAFYNPGHNGVMILLSNLLPPYLMENDDPVLTLAVISSTIGHELTHGFDSDGRKYDKYGAAKDWWAPADTVMFNNYCTQIIDNYSALPVMPWASTTDYCNGKSTLSENIADMGGCCLGLELLAERYSTATPQQMKQLKRRFFQGWAIAWCGSYGLDKAIEQYYNDFHSPLRERCNGVVRNINDWYQVYDITQGALYLEPSKRTLIW